METLRAFVGCLVDLNATRRAVDASRALRRTLDAAGWRCAWAPPPNLHLTLKFLGEVDAGTAPALSDAVARVASRHGPIKLALRDLVVFPDESSPRVLALGVTDGHDALAALARDLDDALADLGFARETRDFRAHMTLARVKHAPGALSSIERPRLDVGVGFVHEIALYRSDLLRNGAEYHSLSRHPLADPRIAQNAAKQSLRDDAGQNTSRLDG